MVFAVAKEQKIRVGVEWFQKGFKKLQATQKKVRQGLKDFNGVMNQSSEEFKKNNTFTDANRVRLKSLRENVRRMQTPFENQQRKTARLTDQYGELGNKTIAAREKLGRMQNKMKDTNGEVSRLSEQQRRYNEVNKKGGNRFKSLSNGIRKAFTGMKGFKMELLGTMFFGMALMRTMGSLLKTSLEWTGVMELLSIAMGILFLPVALELLVWAIEFMSWVGSLSEETKLLIGHVVLGVAAFGAFLFIIGQFGLGIGSIIMLFGSLGFWIATLIPLIALIAIAVFLFRDKIKGLAKPIDDVNDKLIGFGYIGTNSFANVKEGARSLWNFLKGKFVGIWDKIIEKLPSTLSEAKELFLKFISDVPLLIPDMLLAGGKLLTAFGEGITNNAPKIGNAISLVLQHIIDFISDNGHILSDAGFVILNAIVSTVGNNMDKVKEFVSKFLDAFKKFMVEAGPVLNDIAKILIDAFIEVVKTVIREAPALALLGVLIVTIMFGGITSAVLTPLVSGLASLIASVGAAFFTAVGVGWGALIIAALAIAFLKARNMANKAKAFDELGKDIPLSETPGISEAVRQRGTRMVTPHLPEGFQNNQLDLGFLQKKGARPVSEERSKELLMDITYNVNVSDAEKFKAMLRKNNTEIIDQFRREANTG